jgi:FKBP-type peptidyl-prolyl cis-trans isomerase FkpA
MKRLPMTLAAVCALGSGLGIQAAQEGTPPRPSPSPRPAAPSPAVRRVSPAPPAPPVVSHPRPPVAPSLAPIRPEDEAKILYAVGFVLGRETAVFALTPAETEQVTKGFADSLAGATPQFPLETYGPQIRSLAQARQARKADVEKEKGRAYLEQAAREPGAVRADSGLVFVETAKGSGPTPKATDTVKVNYHGTLVDGKVFDSTQGRGPAEFPLSGVIPCWTEGLQKLAVGGKGKLVCPSSIAYGDAGRPGIPGGATLVFDVELLAITPGAAASPAPSAVPRPAPHPSVRASPKAAPSTRPAKPSPPPQ